MDRFLKTAELKNLEKKVSEGEITYSKMIEEINLKAYIFYNSIKSEKTKCEKAQILQAQIDVLENINVPISGYITTQIYSKIELLRQQLKQVKN